MKFLISLIKSMLLLPVSSVYFAVIYLFLVEALYHNELVVNRNVFKLYFYKLV